MRLITKKELYVPTLWGWLLLMLALVLMTRGYVSHIYPFLGVSKPVRAQVLAVEEWIPPSALKNAAREFRDNDYAVLVVLGQEKEWTVPVLVEAGVDKNRIVRVSPTRVPRNRTFSSAVALKSWLTSSGTAATGVNVFTSGVHARRSWILFRKALEPGYSVGIISCSDWSYDPNKWWRSSNGLRAVMNETLAYIYTEFYFLPSMALSRNG